MILDRRITVLRLNASTIYIPRLPKMNAFGYRIVRNDPVELRYLDLGRASYVPPSVLLHLLERCYKLVALSLEGCECLNDQLCAEIAKNGKLHSLDLSMVRGLTPNGIGIILRYCNK